MKTNAISASLVLSCMLSSPLLGQASFELRNYNPLHGVDAPVFDSLGVPLAGTSYRAELWGAMASNSLSPLLDVSEGNSREIVAFRTAGYFVGSSGFLSVLDVMPDGWAWLQVRAWDARLGATYEEVSALGLGGYGESPLFYAQGHDPFREPPEVAAPLVGLQSFSLRPVPEPSAGALLAVAGVAIGWAVRRGLAERERRQGSPD